MGAFFLTTTALLALAVALAVWRRRGAIPYDDPQLTVEALRDRQRFLYDFGMAVGPRHGQDDEKGKRP